MKVENGSGVSVFMLSEFEETFCAFLDHLAPMLDVYEHAIYAYILRHTVVVGSEDMIFAVKSARENLSRGSGQQGRAMSESTCSKKLQSLALKGAVEIVGTEHRGTRVRVTRPRRDSGDSANRFRRKRESLIGRHGLFRNFGKSKADT